MYWQGSIYQKCPSNHCNHLATTTNGNMVAPIDNSRRSNGGGMGLCQVETTKKINKKRLKEANLLHCHPMP